MIHTAAVKARMRALGVTQREAAEKLGYTQATLSLKTNNRRRMTLEEARRWAETCRAHGVDYSRYIGYWAGLLLTLSRLVRAEGRGGSGSDPAPDRMQRQG